MTTDGPTFTEGHAGPTCSGASSGGPRASLFFLGLFVVLLIYFSLMRVGLVIRTHDSASEFTWRELARCLLTGARFDIAVLCYLLLPFIIVAHLPKIGLAESGRNRRRFVRVFVPIVAVMTFLLLAEYEFFHEFQTRYNQLAFDYLEHGKTVGGMLWYNYPVIRYVLLCAGITGLLWLAIRFLLKRCFRSDGVTTWKDAWVLAVLVPLMVIGMRGGLQGEPLRWGNACTSNNEFLNQMGLNGLFALGYAAKDHFRIKSLHGTWTHRTSPAEARGIARELVMGAGDKLIKPDERTLLRLNARGAASVTLHKGKRTPNVVLVIMESMSARFLGAAGAPRDFMPHLSSIAREGILFDRALSSGTHTHQGVFTTLTGFPNLPGHETIMDQMAGNQKFATLPTLLKKRGYQTLFLYNGDFSWDNMRGFFRKQGMDTFIGGKDFPPTVARDKVWGVSDADVFARANEEFARAHETGPFFGLVLTLSNHAPFQVPMPPGYAPTTGMGDLDRRLDAVRYADWAIGRFIEDARKLPYFDDTLFVFVGDHGFHVNPVLTEVHLLYHHVPLIFFAPKLLSRSGLVVHEVAGQTNVVPTVLGLLDLKLPNGAWARDLFRTDYAGENAFVFKNTSGSREVAIARGDKVLVVAPDGRQSLHRFSLAFPPSVADVSDPALESELARLLRGYVHAALSDLNSHRAGMLVKSPQ